jgi:hypothetical protein
MPVINLINMIYTYWNCKQNGLSFLFVSGREDSCMEDTIKWLKYHINISISLHSSINNDNLYMRKTADYRDYTIIKKEIYEKHIKDKYNVLFVLDDRSKVIRMWRSLGLFVFNCAQHDEEF